MCEISSVHYLLYIADMFVNIINDEDAFKDVEESDIIRAISFYLKNEDSDVQYAGQALILNILSISRKSM